MMTCRDFKDIMMAYLDDELDDEQRCSLEEHLRSCRQCSREMDEFRRLKKLTDSVAFVEPEDRLWDQYWSGVFNRIERGLGWALFSVAAILLSIFGGFKMVEAVIKDPQIGVLLKIGILALIAGLSILLVSVARERLFFRQRDRYKDVRR